MSETQMTSFAAASPTKMDGKKLIRDLSLAASTLQSLIDHRDNATTESIRFIPSILHQAQKIMLEAEAQLEQSETKLRETQQIIQNVNELQTLLDLLPVGIIVTHDPKNQNMTINPAGLRMLDLPPGTNPSKSAPGGDKLPFKVLREGQEVPVEELPLDYATTHKIAIHDMELDIQHANGKVTNLIEYASPLYDEKGSVRGSLGVMVDITALKSVEQRLGMQYAIARVLAESNSVNKAAGQVMHMICQTAGWEYGALWRVEPDASTLINEGVWHAEYANLSEYADGILYSILSRDKASLPGQVLRSNQPLWLSSLHDFPSQDTIEHLKAGLQSAFVFPVRSGDKVIAVLECLSNRVQPRDQNLIDMLTAVGNQIGVFLERKQLEEALSVRASQQQLLAQAGIVLFASLDYKTRLTTIAHIIVPDLADWCAFDLIDQNNMLERVATAHVDPAKEEMVKAIQPTRQVNLNQANTPQIQTLLTGQSLLYADVSFSVIEKSIVDPDQLNIIRELNPRSSIIVPLNAHDRILGICTLVQSDSGRHYSASDLVLAEDIVHRVAMALDNAFLYAESQKLNADLERRVDDRTTQLKFAINQLTNQIAERQHAEEEVRILNSELEQRIVERTSQLELANRELNKEVQDRQLASQTLRVLLMQSRELYRISQTIGMVRTPNDLLSLLLSSSYLKSSSRASIAILEKPWIEGEKPPEHCTILAEWNKGASQPRYIARRFTLEEYGVKLPIPFGKPIVIQDIQSMNELSESVRKRFAGLRTHGLIILPLIAGGEWYGLLSLHFKTRRMTNMDDLRHVRGLVDETAIVIKNMRLLEEESQARHEAEMANDLKLKFLAMISHELRTPLTSIKGFATTLLAQDVIWPPEKQLDFLQTINRESDKLSDLIEQLLDLSRMEAGILRIAPKKQSINVILDSALAQLQAITPEHELLMNIPASLPPIFGDGQRIAQVLINLVNNAAKYSPPRTHITISVHQAGEMIQVDVADQGPGIPPQDRLRVFEAFRQLDNGSGNRAKGAGLGLAICKGLIEAQNGKIWIREHRDPGTIISFTLPLWGDTKGNDAT